MLTVKEYIIVYDNSNYLSSTQKAEVRGSEHNQGHYINVCVYVF